MAKAKEIMNEEIMNEENVNEENVNEEATSSVTPDGAAPSTQGEGLKKPYDPWQDMRQVYIPKRSRGEQNTLEVGVNDRTYFVPKDQFVEVPAPVWEVITQMQRQQKALEEYLDHNESLMPSAGKA